MSKVYSLKTVQKLPISLEAAWDFFSSPANLKEITPTNLGFTIVSKHHGKKMYTGQIIEYTVKPVLGIPLYWMTEITHVVDKQFFVDEQRKGPYNIWHHEHHFKSVEGGVLMTDILHYDVGLGIFGWVASKLFVVLCGAAFFLLAISPGTFFPSKRRKPPPGITICSLLVSGAESPFPSKMGLVEAT